MSTNVYKDITTNKKIDLRVWIKVFKYLLPLWPFIILLIFWLMAVSFYDSSFVPSMNAALINASKTDLNFYTDIFKVNLNLNILGFKFSITFLQYIIIYIIMILIRSVGIFIVFYLSNYFAMKIMTSLRTDAFKKIQELSFSYYDKTPSGWLISRLQNDASNIGDIVGNSLINVFWIVLALIFTLITMFTINWELSLIILATTPFVFIIIVFFEKIILKASRIARSAYSDFARWLSECINGSQTIKTLAIEETIFEESKEITNDVMVKRRKSMKVGASFYPIISIISSLTSALIIILFPIFGANKEATFNTATLVLFIGFVGQIYDPLKQLSELFSELMNTQANVEKMFSLLDTKPELVDTPEVIEKYGDIFNNKVENFEKIKGDIEFSHIYFSYNKDTEIIHDLNLIIKEGTSVAFVGETGSGKSTTVNLLCRFYEPTKGTILIDGLDYKSRSVGWLRSNIGYVQQTPFIFKGTVLDNIRYGNHNATKEEIISICKLLDIDEFISNLKDGYDTYLKDGGSELSLGQKQLISFARALIRNPSILILDEATSSIDTETEAKIQTSIEKMLKGRTSIMIAHRLSTIVNCDSIFVMKDGYIIENGTHKELMNKKGYYYSLYMNQFKDLEIDSQLDIYQNQILDKDIKL